MVDQKPEDKNLMVDQKPEDKKPMVDQKPDLDKKLDNDKKPESGLEGIKDKKVIPEGRKIGKSSNQLLSHFTGKIFHSIGKIFFKGLYFYDEHPILCFRFSTHMRFIFSFCIITVFLKGLIFLHTSAHRVSYFVYTFFHVIEVLVQFKIFTIQPFFENPLV